ncbi:MAG: GNAT family N-acetyltransferase [Thermoplasmata archaeon]|nr:GNAT family N-acetyltransferase [Thermoplasmata archaeon]
MRIRAMKPGDYPEAERIGKSLGHTKDGKGWFTERAWSRYIPFDIRIHRGFVAEDEGTVVGFITYSSYDTPATSPYISWIAVSRKHQGKGAGRRLVRRAERECLKAGAEFLWVETPTREAGRGTEYEGTYKFYERIGFELERVISESDPGNGCDCDMAVLRKVLD